MADHLIDSRGYFWSAEITVPEGHFAPDQFVSGRLRLHVNGRSELDLDNAIDLTGSPSAVGRIFARGADVEGAICGFLFDGNKHVWLTRLRGDGGTLGGAGPIRERLIVDHCLVAREAFRPGEEPRFRWLDLPLNGYEEWLGRGHITVRRNRSRISADYPLRPQPRRWQVDTLSLELHRGLEGSAGEGVTKLDWREYFFLRLRASKADMTVSQAIEYAERIEDLLVLLADHDQRLPFGQLRRTRTGKPVEFYYARGGRDRADELQWHRAWVRFEPLADQLGALVASWLTKYQVYGPGFHLYLGNRRGQAMYPEHHFASLIWGLEALHRSLVPPTSIAAQSAKVERILAQIQLDKDRKWAARFLPDESEPALAERLLDLFMRLDLGLGRKQLAAFAKRCADRRNDVSHFGGQREPGGYDAFLEDIVKLSGAIDELYHALILLIVGVPDGLVRWHFFGSPNSYATRQRLAHGGLVVPEPAP